MYTKKYYKYIKNLLKALVFLTSTSIECLKENSKHLLQFLRFQNNVCSSTKAVNFR